MTWPAKSTDGQHDAQNSDVASRLETASHIPIAQLTPLLNAPGTRYIRAITSLIWPYTSSEKALTLLLTEPDFRLRGNRGQVRVHFGQPCVKQVEEAKVRIGDELLLSLEGVQWLRDDLNIGTPGKSVECELRFARRLSLQVLRDRNRVSIIEVNRQTPSPRRSPDPTERTRTPEPFSTPRHRLSTVIGAPQWTSPAFSRIGREAPPFKEASSPDDLFSIDDGYIEGKGRKRPRFSMGKDSWRYVERSPSPQKDHERFTSTVDSISPFMTEVPSLDPFTSRLEGGRPGRAHQFLFAQYGGDVPAPKSNISPPMNTMSWEPANTKAEQERQDAASVASSPGISQRPLEVLSPQTPIHETDASLMLPPSQHLQVATPSSQHSVETPDSPRLAPVPSPLLPTVSPFTSRASGPRDFQGQEQLESITSAPSTYQNKVDDALGHNLVEAPAGISIQATDESEPKDSYSQDLPQTSYLTGDWQPSNPPDTTRPLDAYAANDVEVDASQPQRFTGGQNIDSAIESQNLENALPKSFENFMADGPFKTPQSGLEHQNEGDQNAITSFILGHGAEPGWTQELNVPSPKYASLSQQSWDPSTQNATQDTRNVQYPTDESWQFQSGQPPASQPIQVVKQDDVGLGFQPLDRGVTIEQSNMVSHLVASEDENDGRESVISTESDENVGSERTRSEGDAEPLARHTTDRKQDDVIVVEEIESDSSEGEEESLRSTSSPSEREIPVESVGIRSPQRIDKSNEPEEVDQELEREDGRKASEKLDDARKDADATSPYEQDAVRSQGLQEVTGPVVIGPHSQDTEQPEPGIVVTEQKLPPPIEELVNAENEPSDRPRIEEEKVAQSQESVDREFASADSESENEDEALSSTHSNEKAGEDARKVSQHHIEPKVARLNLRSRQNDIPGHQNVEKGKSIKEASPVNRKLEPPQEIQEEPVATQKPITPPAQQKSLPASTKAPLHRHHMISYPALAAGLRTSKAYFTSFKNLASYHTSSIDALSIVTHTTRPSRAASGPRDYHLTLSLTEPSTYPTETKVQIFRPFRDALPRAAKGDVILLRAFKVVTLSRKLSLCSTEESAWAVWREQVSKENEQQDGKSCNVENMRVQINGPPVEWGKEEEGHVATLKHWWEDVSSESISSKI